MLRKNIETIRWLGPFFGLRSHISCFSITRLIHYSTAKTLPMNANVACSFLSIPKHITRSSHLICCLINRRGLRKTNEESLLSDFRNCSKTRKERINVRIKTGFTQNGCAHLWDAFLRFGLVWRQWGARVRLDELRIYIVTKYSGHF